MLSTKRAPRSPVEPAAAVSNTDRGVIEAIGYIRVSTNEQAASGLGLDAQRARIKAYCLSQSWHLIHVYQEAQSAKSLARPQLQKAIEELRPGRILVALKFDRISRTASDLDRFTAAVQNQGGDWATVEGQYDTSNAMGRFLLRIVADIAQMERELIGERTKAALNVKRVRGEYFGAPPLGHVVIETETGRELRAVTDELETVTMAREMRDSGMSFAAIAAEFTRRGRHTKRGGKWDPQTVRRLTLTRYTETLGDRNS